MTTDIAQGPVEANVRQDFKDAEQAAFEKWLHDMCPSGDVEVVQRKWLESYEYAELLDDQEANLYPADADEPMTLSYEDLSSSTWRRLTDELTSRLFDLRAMNDKQDLNEVQTAVIRGKIAEVKRILSLAPASDGEGGLGDE